MGKFSVDIENLDEAQERIGATSEQMVRAGIRAVKKALSFAEGSIAKDIAKQNDIPLKALRVKGRKRVKASRVGVSKQRGSVAGFVWIGMQPIRLEDIGRLKPMYSGRKEKRKEIGWQVGGFTFEGAFLTGLSSGKTGIFERMSKGERRTEGRPATSSPNLPIWMIHLDIDGEDHALLRAKEKIGPRLQDLMWRELNYEVNVRGNR